MKNLIYFSILTKYLTYFTSKATDEEVAMLSLAILANILSYSDSLLLADTITIESLGVGMPIIVNIFRTSIIKRQLLYAGAAIANASFHPRLAQLINEHEGNIKSPLFLPCFF